MPNHKHLTLDDRCHIQASLNAGHSFRQIARSIDKDPSTISKEVRHHRVPSSTGAVGRIPNKCIHLIRKKLNDRSPITTFSFFHGDLILRKLGLQAIPPGEVTLTPELLAVSKEVSKHEKEL